MQVQLGLGNVRVVETVKTLRDCKHIARRKRLAGEIIEDGELIATVKADGSIYDLCGRPVTL